MVLRVLARAGMLLAVSSHVALAGAYQDDVPLSDYLRTLEQIMPAARDGAQAYMRAFQQNCGRPMRTVELRRAVADGPGDPILMAMIRAAHYKDEKALENLATAVSCTAETR